MTQEGDFPCLKCKLSARCCTRGVEVTAEEVSKIDSLDIPIPKPWFGTHAISWHDNKPKTVTTTVTSHGCVFLTKDFLCGIHQYCLEHDLPVEKYKPLLCQRFPFEESSEDVREDYKVFCGIFFGEQA